MSEYFNEGFTTAEDESEYVNNAEFTTAGVNSEHVNKKVTTTGDESEYVNTGFTTAGDESEYVNNAEVTTAGDESEYVNNTEFTTAGVNGEHVNKKVTTTGVDSEHVNEKANPTKVEDVSVVVPEEKSVQEKSKGEGQGHWCVKVLLGLVILLLIAIVTLVVVYFVVLKDDDDDDKKTDVEPNPNTGGREEDIEICTSRDCIITAGVIAQKMDPTVDPCQNFADFACGGFYRETIVPRNRRRTGPFYEGNEANYDLMRDVIEAEVSPNDPEYLVKFKECYWSCINEDTVGLEHFLNSSFPSMWPTLNPAWDPASFDINQTMIEYALHGITPFMEIDVHPDLFNSSKHVIYVKMPSRSLISMDDFASGPRNGSLLLALHKYIVQTAVEVGADPDVASADADEFIDFLIRIALATVESGSSTWKWKLSTLKSYLPQIDLMSVLQAKFNKTGIQLDGGQYVLVVGPNYFLALWNIINDTDPRTLQNFFALSHAHAYLGGLTERLRDFRFELNKELLGIRMGDPTWFQCLAEISYFMWKGMGKEFVKKKLLLYNETELMDYMNEMTDSVKVEFSEIIDQADWLANTTKQAAQEKLAKMGVKIGYPHEDFTESDLNNLYQNISFAKDNFFANRQVLGEFQSRLQLSLLTKEVDRSRWSTRLIEVNAHYTTFTNEMIIPMGILTPIFFSDVYPDSLNYAGTASVVGHEITHGFDEIGSLFDATGTYKNWWQPEDRAEFSNRIQCIADQYDAFVHPQVNLSLIGEKMLGEAISDLGGLKIAFRAFKKKYEASSMKEKPLPGLGFTPYQQFYMNFAQRYCQAYTDEWLASHILYQVHPPGRFRIIGTLQNDEEFAKAFNCPSGSYMNPTDKCVVW